MQSCQSPGFTAPNVSFLRSSTSVLPVWRVPLASAYSEGRVSNQPAGLRVCAELRRALQSPSTHQVRHALKTLGLMSAVRLYQRGLTNSGATLLPVCRIPEWQQAEVRARQSTAPPDTFPVPCRFNCQLARMQQRKPSGWFVVYLNLDSGYFEEISVDFVVVCSGLNSLPYIPNYPVSFSAWPYL